MSWQFDFCGDHLALDFANTVSDRGTDTAVEQVGDYAELVAFARQAGIVPAARARALLERAQRDPAAARAVHRRALALREALYRLFAAVARARAPAADDVAVLNAELPRLRVGEDLSFGWTDDADRLDGFLGAVVHAALTLATSATERARVRICEAPDCEWLFYDTSRNRSRRWCDMRQCGNRMKARRHYARERSGDGTPAQRRRAGRAQKR